MKIRDAVFLVIGGLLVISGMVLNSVLVGDADAQGSGLNGNFRYITCRGIAIKDGNKLRGAFLLDTNGNAMLQIYDDDDGKTPVVYLGGNTKVDNEIMLRFISKSKTDKREVSMGIDRNGGRFDCDNKMGEPVVRLGVGDDGGGVVDVRDKHGYTK